MLFAKAEWDKTTTYMMVNEIFMTKLKFYTELDPVGAEANPEAKELIEDIIALYSENSELLASIADQLQERELIKNETSLTKHNEKHIDKINEILHQIYCEVD